MMGKLYKNWPKATLESITMENKSITESIP